MGKQYKQLTQKDIEFIKKQKLFYIASSSVAETNLSPKGHDSIRVIDSNTLIFLDYIGSGNRTARDIKNSGEITIVFNEFKEKAKILRLFCKGKIINKYDNEFSKLFEMFDEDKTIIRDIFIFSIYAVETSCGMSIPKMEYIEDRDELKQWLKENKNSLKSYIESHENPVNLKSI